MAGNLALGFLAVSIFALLLCFGELIAWTVTELPGIIADMREFRRWKKWHTRVFF